MATSRPQLNVAFGRVLRAYRLQAGLTQEALASACGIDPTYVSQLERGKKSPSLNVTQALAEAFQRSAHDLVREAEAAVDRA